MGFTLLSYIVPFGSQTETEVWYEVSTPNGLSVPMQANLAKLLVLNNLATNPNTLPYNLLKTAKFTWPKGYEALKTKTPYTFMLEFLGHQVLAQVLKLGHMSHMDSITLSLLSMDNFTRYIDGITTGTGISNRARTIQIYFRIYTESENIHGEIVGNTLKEFNNSLINYIVKEFPEVTNGQAAGIARVYSGPLFLLHSESIKQAAIAKESKDKQQENKDTLKTEI